MNRIVQILSDSNIPDVFSEYVIEENDASKKIIETIEDSNIYIIGDNYENIKILTTVAKIKLHPKMIFYDFFELMRNYTSYSEKDKILAILSNKKFIFIYNIIPGDIFTNYTENFIILLNYLLYHKNKKRILLGMMHPSKGKAKDVYGAFIRYLEGNVLFKSI